MKTATFDAQIVTKSPALLTLPAVEYWENLATVSLRRLWFMRSRDGAREAIAGWIRTLRDTRRVRLYRGW